MAERVVVNTGPLIAVARAGAVDILAKLAIEFVSPLEVRAELDDGIRAGHPVIDATWVTFEPLRTPVSGIALAQGFVPVSVEI